MDARAATLALLSARLPGTTICPSEVARVLAGEADRAVGSEWRGRMPAVHSAVDRLLAEGRIQLSWKGRTLPSRAGPYRIGRANPG